MKITSEKYSPSIMNCARYLGSKLPLNNRASRTFSCIDPTARGSEWTGKLLKTIPELLSWAPPPPSGKKGFPICGAFLQLCLVTGAFFGPYWGSCLGLPTSPPPPTKINFCGRPWLLSLAGYVRE